jgi:hypothetical protein
VSNQPASAISSCKHRLPVRDSGAPRFERHVTTVTYIQALYLYFRSSTVNPKHSFQWLLKNFGHSADALEFLLFLTESWVAPLIVNPAYGAHQLKRVPQQEVFHAHHFPMAQARTLREAS